MEVAGLLVEPNKFRKIGREAKKSSLIEFHQLCEVYIIGYLVKLVTM